MNTPISQRNLAAMLTCSALLSACSVQQRIVERTPERGDQVGTVGVSVVSAAPWQLFVKGLQPKFEMDADEALRRAGASTRQVEDSYSKALQASIKLAPEIQSSTRKSSNATDSKGVATTTSSSSSDSGPGDLSKVGNPTIPGATLPEPLPGLSSEGGINPQLHYQLATALFQEVQLLNKYVQSAPSLRGYTPFVVRLQINVRQFGRNTPYDTDVDIAFSCSPICGDAGRNPPVVAVPLLVNDSMEITSAAVARRNAVALGLALSALRGGFGVGADVGSNTVQLLRSMGSEFNSLLSVGRKPGDDSAVSVRIGSFEKGPSTHELVPRSHMVTLLLLVPDGIVQSDRIARLTHTTKVTFLHARTGDRLDGDDSKGRFELEYFRAARLPGSQYAYLNLTGTKPPYTGDVTLRGGDALTKNMIDAICLTKSDSARPRSAPACANDSTALFADEFDATDDRNGLTAKFIGKFAKLGAKDSSAPAAPLGVPPADMGYLCVDPVSEYRDPVSRLPLVPTCLKLHAPLQFPTVEPPPKLVATVTVGEARLLASRQGVSSVTIAVAMPEDKKLTPDSVEVTLTGAGVSGVRQLSAGPPCVALSSSIRVSANCMFKVQLANASDAKAVELKATAKRPNQDPAKALSVPLDVEPASLEVVADRTKYLVVVPSTAAATARAP